MKEGGEEKEEEQRKEEEEEKKRGGGGKGIMGNTHIRKKLNLLTFFG